MTVLWIPGNLLGAPTPAVMAGAINDPGSPVRSVLDDLYLTDFASNAEAVAGTNTGKAISPASLKAAVDSWQQTRPAPVTFVRYSSGSWTLPAGTHTLLGINDGGRWTTDGGSVTAGNADITVAAAGVYRFEMSLALGYSTDPSGYLAAGFADPAVSTAMQNLFGYAEATKTGILMVTSVVTVRLPAGGRLRPRVYLSQDRAFSAAENIDRNFLSVQRLGA